MSPTRSKLPTRPRWLIIGAVLTISLIGASTATAAPGEIAADSAEVGSYAVFNEPAPGGVEPDFAVQDSLIELIEGTPTGETIYGSTFSFSQTPVAEALRDAQERGAHVRLAIDGGTDDAGNEAQNILKAAGLDQLVYCSGPNDSTSCIGTVGGINHNKTFAFSHTGDKAGALWVSSQNLTGYQGRLYNNAVVHYGRPGLYQAFEKHMAHMLAQDKDNDYYNSDTGSYVEPDGEVAIYQSPRADSSGGIEPEAKTDTIAELLSTVEYEEGCRIDVTQAYFTGTRTSIHDHLIRLGAAGCDVRIVYGAHLSNATYDYLHGKPGITMRGFFDATDPAKHVTIHSKIFTIHALVEGKHQDVVLSGSHNVNRPALRMNDEILLVTRQADIAADFDANFEHMWTSAVCVNAGDVVCTIDS